MHAFMYARMHVKIPGAVLVPARKHAIQPFDFDVLTKMTVFIILAIQACCNGRVLI
jgi:hypothetical protein